jgi:hypothetical protein
MFGSFEKRGSTLLDAWYKFSEPFGSDVEACTSFYKFSGAKMANRLLTSC